MPKTLRKFVNRRNKTYHGMRISEVNNQDKAASYLLAMNYSGRTSQTKVSQSLIQMDCVAVAVVNNEWLIASNSQRLTDDDVQALADELGTQITYALVKRGSGYMHAEMQVAEEIKASGYDLDGVYIGVSKPCCLDCKNVLDTHGMRYIHYHDSTVVNWEAPDLS